MDIEGYLFNPSILCLWNGHVAQNIKIEKRIKVVINVIHKNKTFK